jgi:outer membrane protein OmpA-like peptidoglycan-associated protein
MPDPAPSRVEAEPPMNGAAAQAREMARLRELLIGPEQEQIAKLQQRLDDPSVRAGELAEVLPEAVRAAREVKLQKALDPVLDRTVRQFVLKHPRELADAIYPIIGPAIRRAVSAAIRDMAESLNQIAEKSMSFRALRWRLEALMSGKPFSELLLARSLLYSVEQVFLIHRQGGLLLQHVVAKSAVVKDADMVSGMLTAIQDFVSDSFVGAGQELEMVKVGEFKLWMQHGPKAVLAGAVRGSPPMELKALFRQAIEGVHAAFAAELESFQGDVSSFDATRPYLEACLLGQSGLKPRRSLAPWLILTALVALVMVWGFISIRDTNRWQGYVRLLKSQPGIVVTSAEKCGSQYCMAGLLDPLASDPSQLLKQSGIAGDRVKFQWQPYFSLDPQVSTQRKFTSAKERIERLIIRFETASSKLGPAQAGALEEAAALLRELFASASAGRVMRIVVTGHTDEVGTEVSNQKLSQDRADVVIEALTTQGVTRDRMTVIAAGTSRPLRTAGTAWDRASNRSVSFRVIEPQ